MLKTSNYTASLRLTAERLVRQNVFIGMAVFSTSINEPVAYAIRCYRGTYPDDEVTDRQLYAIFDEFLKDYNKSKK